MTCNSSPFTKKQRIELLVREANAQREQMELMGREIAALRARIAVLEAERPVYPWPQPTEPNPWEPRKPLEPYISWTDGNTQYDIVVTKGGDND